MTAYYNENDPFTAEWLRNLILHGLIAEGDVDERSIEEVSADDLRPYVQCHFFAGIGVWSHALRRAGWPDDRPVWTGSCPCQPFSLAGSGLGFDDPRHLWPHWLRLIRQRRPDTVFGEQVASANAWLDLVQADLEGLGFAVGAVDMPAAGFSGAHIRQRFKWVADRYDAERRTDLAGGYVLDGPAAGRIEGHGQPGAGGDAGGMALTHGGNTSPERQQRGREQRQQQEDDLAGGAGHPHHERRYRFGQGSEQAGRRDPSFPSGLAGIDWLLCRDAKLRPVEPGTFPLAPTSPGRVGQLRAYGNAIDAEAATQFVGAYLDTFV